MYFEHNTLRLISSLVHTWSETCSANFPAGLALQYRRPESRIWCCGVGAATPDWHTLSTATLRVLSFSLSYNAIHVCMFALKSRCRLRLPPGPFAVALCSFISAGDIKTSYMRSGCTLWVLHAHLSLECSDLSPHCCIFTKLSNPRRVRVCVRRVNWKTKVFASHYGRGEWAARKRHTRKAN